MKLCKCGCGTVVKNMYVRGHNRRKISKAKILVIKKLYLKNFLSSYGIAKKLGIGTTSVRRYLKKLNIVRNLSEAQKVAAIKGRHRMKTLAGRKLQSLKMKGHSYNRRYNYDRSFFKKLNKKSAYIIGFFMADGCLNGYRIMFASKDRDILEKIASVIGEKRPKYRNGYYHLIYYSHQMVRDLKRLAIDEKKTHRLKMINLPENLLNHFIRGFFDGDGGVSYNKANGQIVSYIDCSSLEFLKWLKSILPAIGGIIRKRKNVDCFELRFGTRDSRILYNFLYSRLQEGDLFLERKKVKFENLMGVKM